MKETNTNTKRIIFINRFFYPDYSATSQLLTDLAQRLVNDKTSVEIVTSRQKYNDAKVGLKKYEKWNGVTIHRIWTTQYGRQNLFGRMLDYLTFYISTLFYLLIHVRAGDVLVAKTDPPMISVITVFVTKAKKAILINWIQDLFPEVARGLGIKALGVIYPFLVYMRNISLNAAHTNVVLGERMAERLIELGVVEDNIRVIHNWADGDNIIPINRKENTLRKEWGIQDKFVVGYSGNIGRAHEFETIIESAKMLRNECDIIFLIIGAGAQYKLLRETVKNSDLKNIIFKPYQPKNMLSVSLTLPDLHFISLKPEMEGLIVPSKFYGRTFRTRSSISSSSIFSSSRR